MSVCIVLLALMCSNQINKDDIQAIRIILYYVVNHVKLAYLNILLYFHYISVLVSIGGMVVGCWCLLPFMHTYLTLLYEVEIGYKDFR